MTAATLFGYDLVGNLTSQWDHRNRLVTVTERPSVGADASKTIAYAYDVFDRRIRKTIDEDGDGPGAARNETYIYDGQHIVLVFEDADDAGPQAAQLTHRYLHGPAVDQILADEQLTSTSTPGNVLWPLTDHLGSVRDIAEYHEATGITEIVNHLTYDAFGNIVSEANAAVDFVIGYAGLERDEETGFFHSQTRYYDPLTGRWTQQDWITFRAGDPNLYRYVGNGPTNANDPSGLQPPDSVRDQRRIRFDATFGANSPTNLTDPLGTLPAGMEKALEALATKQNGTPEQLAAARQWLEDLLTIAKNLPQPAGWDRCWKWAGGVLGKAPAPPNADIVVRLQAWYYPKRWNPINGYLTHATVQIKIGDAVFYIDNGWWGDKPGAVFGPDEVSPRAKRFDLLSPPPDPLWWQGLRFQMDCGTIIYLPDF